MSDFRFLGERWWDRLVPVRVRAAYAALRGRPVAYRLTVRGSVLVKGPHAFIAECHRVPPAGESGVSRGPGGAR
jgi:hypothetical protein